MVSVTPRNWITKAGRKRRGYQVTWQDNQGRQQRKLFSGPTARAAANAKRFDIELAERTGAPVTADGKALSVRLAGERWVRYVERELKRERTTWVHYEQELRDHIAAAEITRADGTIARFGDLPVTAVTAPDCEALKDALLAKLGIGMAGRLMVRTRMLFNDVARRGEIAANPAANAKVRQVARGEDEIVIPEEDDVRALVKAVTTEPPQAPTFIEAWIVTTIFSGLRPSENRGAAIEDIELDAQTPGIWVRRRADAWSALGPVKTRNGRRFVPLPPVVIALLKRWLLVVPLGFGDQEKGTYVDGVPDPEKPGRRIHLLFPTSRGTVQTLPNVYNRAWLPAMIAAGLVRWEPKRGKAGRQDLDEHGKPALRAIANYPINSLRHFNASLLIAEAWDPKTIQKRLGHGSIQVTFDMYGHLFAKRALDASPITKIEHKLLG